MAQQSRQTIYSNEDLNKPITGSKSKAYTNADLDVEDDFQPDSDDFAASAEDDFQPDEPIAPNNITAVSKNAPDTWREGFINSIMSGDALDAGLEGAKGFAKGAILDLPESVMGGLRMAGNALALSAGPVGEMITGRSTLDRIKEIPSGLYDVGKNILDTTMNAGGEPEEFGRMMGNVTGQPLVTAGLTKGAPSMVRGVGAVTENTGRIMRQHAPMSGMIPRLMEPRLARTVERGLGRGVENIGQRMRNVGRAPNEPNVPLAQQVLDEGAPEVQLPQNPNLNRTPDVPETTPQMSPSAIEAMEQVRPTKPAVRLNPDGTYTRFDTGEVVDSMGKPMATPPKVPKELTIKNAPPNQRAKLFRGANDSVDVLFENANDRRIFGAGQNMFSAGGTTKPGLVQTFRTVTEEIAQQYGLPVQEAAKLVTDYNRRLRALSKDMPKYGEDLNFKAPSFETFMDSALRGKQ